MITTLGTSPGFQLTMKATVPKRTLCLSFSGHTLPWFIIGCRFHTYVTQKFQNPNNLLITKSP